ncbi:MAG: hypothetical protein KF696_01960 [Planctomycetes bacterium]|nr:hypothetical protein [Planctomycetota bacterium]MCW8134766.1 hypothetical protein [Planctomycetota bacterium]
MSSDVRKVEDSGWRRPLEVLAAQPPQVRESMAAHLGYPFSKTAGNDPAKQAAEIIDTDRKGMIARLNGWRSFVPTRNVTWAEVVDRLTNAFGVPAQLDKSIEQREKHLQKLFHEKGLPQGSVISSVADAVHDGQVVKAARRPWFDPVRLVMQTLQGLASLYTTDAAPAVNCVYAILEMLHPTEVQAPFSAIPTKL